MQDLDLQGKRKCDANAQELNYSKVRKNVTFAIDDTNTHNNPVTNENNCNGLLCVSTCDGRPKIALSAWSFCSLLCLVSSMTGKILIQNPTTAVATSSVSCVGAAIFLSCVTVERCWAIDRMPHYNRRKSANAIRPADDIQETSNFVIAEQPRSFSNNMRRSN